MDLALKSNALWVRTDSNETGGLSAASTRTNRVRLTLEVGRTIALSASSTLTPMLQGGLRHDDGDAETRTGLEVGAGVQYASGMLSVEARIRGLAAHGEEGYEE